MMPDTIETENPKLEIRNSKQVQMIKTRNSMFQTGSFRISLFGFRALLLMEVEWSKEKKSLPSVNGTACQDR